MTFDDRPNIPPGFVNGITDNASLPPADTTSIRNAAEEGVVTTNELAFYQLDLAVPPHRDFPYPVNEIIWSQIDTSGLVSIDIRQRHRKRVPEMDLAIERNQ